jgi:peptidoglycan/xylan/chitin deacetylase (PgdA/CDA1 family)
MISAKKFVYWGARAIGLFALARKVTSRQVRILCYHGGASGDEWQFNPLLFCTGEHLGRRIRWLRRTGFTFVSLDEAVGILKLHSTCPRMPVVFTFDDGWSSTAGILGPVVRRYAVPATLYLCTSHYLNGHAVPEVTIAYMVWSAGRRSVLLADLAPTLDGRYDLSRQVERQRLTALLLAWVKSGPCSAQNVHERLTSVARALCLADPESIVTDRRFHYMRQEELKELHESGWSIQLHGHEHQYHAGHPRRIYDDLTKCRTVLMGLGLSNGCHYCYPSGNHDAVAHEVLARVQVRSATTCLPGLAKPSNQPNLHYLPRFLDGSSIDDVVFEAEMSGFADGVRWLARVVGLRGR